MLLCACGLLGVRRVVSTVTTRETRPSPHCVPSVELACGVCGKGKREICGATLRSTMVGREAGAVSVATLPDEEEEDDCGGGIEHAASSMLVPSPKASSQRRNVMRFDANFDAMVDVIALAFRVLRSMD